MAPFSHSLSLRVYNTLCICIMPPPPSDPSVVPTQPQQLTSKRACTPPHGIQHSVQTCTHAGASISSCRRIMSITRRSRMKKTVEWGRQCRRRRTAAQQRTATTVATTTVYVIASQTRASRRRICKVDEAHGRVRRFNRNAFETFVRNDVIITQARESANRYWCGCQSLRAKYWGTDTEEPQLWNVEMYELQAASWKPFCVLLCICIIVVTSMRRRRRRPSLQTDVANARLLSGRALPRSSIKHARASEAQSMRPQRPASSVQFADNQISVSTLHGHGNSSEDCQS